MAFSSISVSSFLSPVKTFVFGYGNHPDDQDDLNSSSVETPGNSVIKTLFSSFSLWLAAFRSGNILSSSFTSDISVGKESACNAGDPG